MQIPVIITLSVYYVFDVSLMPFSVHYHITLILIMFVIQEKKLPAYLQPKYQICPGVKMKLMQMMTSVF